MLGLRSSISLFILQLFFINSVVSMSTDILTMANPAQDLMKAWRLGKTSASEAKALAQSEKITQDPLKDNKYKILSFNHPKPPTEKTDRTRIDLKAKGSK
ncbi:hypothetical protein PCANC_08659 [Puccinia coronata f. sp. avenae]|uniref:Uncharacterized protein n=1 Tax=Puccinia coronata f. sp. avenae TaxID=200324 RepID=A0A2N5T5Y8_9BASI|nr:hypothetical protein PCANC_08659 [Puccinia coronata f. sp. avenae]